MDVVKAVETYITKMVSTPSSMKVLLLDNHTVRFGLHVCLSDPMLTRTPSLGTDSHRLAFRHSVDAPVAPGLPDGQDRQQQARPHAAHEVRLLPPTERGELRSPHGGAPRAQVRRVLPLSVSTVYSCPLRHVHRSDVKHTVVSVPCRFQQHFEQDCNRAVSGRGRV